MVLNALNNCPIGCSTRETPVEAKPSNVVRACEPTWAAGGRNSEPGGHARGSDVRKLTGLDIQIVDLCNTNYMRCRIVYLDMFQ